MAGSVKQITPGISMGTKAGLIIETTQKKVEPDAIGQSSPSSDEWARWGTDNKYPLNILDKAKQDPVSMGAIGFKIDAHYGMGPQLFKKSFANGKEILEPVDITQYPEIDDFFFENDIPNFLQGIIHDFEWFYRYHVQYIPNKTRTKILKVNSGLDDIGGANFLRTKDIRKKKRNKATGKMEGFYVSSDWSESVPERVFVPSFDPKNPFGKPNAIYEHKMISNSNDYYITPRWYSNLKWLEVAARIPEWIGSNIQNSVNIKYHIHIPEQYFIDLYPRDRYATDQECFTAREEAEQALKQSIDDMLAGEKNVHKAFYTKFAVDDSGNVMPGWKIEPITNDIKDTAWLNADQTAAIRILTAHNVDPGLAGIVISNSSAGSGSDVREKFNYHIQLKTVIPRQTTTEWFEFVKRFNKWEPSLHLGYKNVILQTLNENKSGFAVQNEPTPTTTTK